MPQNPESRRTATHFFILGQMGDNLSRRLKIALTITPFIILLLIWSWITVSGKVPSVFLPSPLEVLQALSKLSQNENLGADLCTTLIRSSIGFLLAIIFSILLLILMFAFVRVRALLLTFLSLAIYVPIPSWIKILLVWLGFSGNFNLSLVVVGSVLFNVFVLIEKNEFLPMNLLDSTLALRSSRSNLSLRIIYSYVVLRILQVSRINFVVAWQLTIFSEWGNPSTGGIGRILGQSMRYLRTDQLFAVAILAGIVGFTIGSVLQNLIDLVYDRLTPHPTIAD